MRTSNKILLTVFLAAIGIFAGIHIALYAKYKSGDFTSAKEMWRLNYTRHELKMVRYIVANGMENISIIPSDTAQLEIEKMGASRIRFQVVGDSLVLRGDTTVTRNDGSVRTERSWTPVNIYIPSVEYIRADDANFVLKGVTDSARANSYRIDLMNGAEFRVAENEWNDSATRFFRKLDVQGTANTQVELSRYAVIRDLNLSLYNATFHDKGAVIGTFTLKADSKSSININGANLQHLSLRKEP